MLLVQSHQEKIAIVMHVIQGRNNVTRVRVQSRSCDKDGEKNDTFILSAT